MKIILDNIEQLVQHVVELRGIDTPCQTCAGLGTQIYPSTATWHGGMGGMTITQDVCSKCWGSGDANKPWLSHRIALQYAESAERFKKQYEKLWMAIGAVVNEYDSSFANPTQEQEEITSRLIHILQEYNPNKL